MVTRRSFLRYTGAGTLTLVGFCATTGRQAALADALPGGTLDPRTIRQFVTPLTAPGVMPRRRRLRPGESDDAATEDRSAARGRGWLDVYDVSARQVRQQILPAGMPATTVWAYGPAGDDPCAQGADDDRRGGRPSRGRHYTPSLTIEADCGVPTRVTWRNELVDAAGRPRPPLLPVDPTLHWANPGRLPGHGGLVSTDIRPDFTGRTFVPPSRYTDPRTQYTTYQGPVPLVTHVHGARGIGDESDGYPEAWVLPGTRLPAGYAAHGRWYEFFAAKAKARHGVTWRPGTQISQYPNLNRACTLWFHDHTLGMTRTTVYAGLAGLFMVRGGDCGDGAVLDRRTGRRAVLPGPAPSAPDHGPATGLGEIPVLIQDRSFNRDGSLFFPDSRAFFDEYAGPYVPASPLAPVWNPEFFGNTMVVNGATWPVLDLEQRRVRLRFLNGCDSRFLLLDLAAIPGAKAWQIGNDAGFLTAPLDLSREGGRVLLPPAGRADVILDLTDTPVGTHVLRNLGPDEPYGGGEPGTDFEVADPATTGRVMALRVRARKGVDRTTPPADLVLPAVPALPAPRRTRRVALMEHAHEVTSGEAPTAALLGVIDGDPGAGMTRARHLTWMDEVTENPAVGDTEVWEIYNLTVDAHPIHLHEVAFEVVERQGIHAEHDMVELVPGTVTRPRACESGRQETVVALPGQVTRIKATFTVPGQFVWHCHLLSHEDNEMMRPYRVGPVQPGQPPSMPMHGH